MRTYPVSAHAITAKQLYFTSSAICSPCDFAVRASQSELQPEPMRAVQALRAHIEDSQGLVRLVVTTAVDYTAGLILVSGAVSDQDLKDTEKRKTWLTSSRSHTWFDITVNAFASCR